jgi:thiamine-phosphate pyrophosphorylase
MAAGASYLGVGPAFATATKVGLPSPIGPVTVAAVVEGGVHGLALVDAVHGADDPASAVRELRIELGAPALS